MSRQLEFDGGFAAKSLRFRLADEMSESFLAYSLSVITLAIPDARRPQARTAAHPVVDVADGVRPGTPFRSRRIVGDTMGRYPPMATQRSTTPWSEWGRTSAHGPVHRPAGQLRIARRSTCRRPVPNVGWPSRHGHGARTRRDTVDFRPTYDGEGDEPVVLPAALPNILVNGTSGIAVGMATNMAPHNLREIEKAIELVITKRRPKPTIDELMAMVPGPTSPPVASSSMTVYERPTKPVRARSASVPKHTSSKRAGPASRSSSPSSRTSSDQSGLSARSGSWPTTASSSALRALPI